MEQALRARCVLSMNHFYFLLPPFSFISFLHVPLPYQLLSPFHLSIISFVLFIQFLLFLLFDFFIPNYISFQHSCNLLRPSPMEYIYV